MKTHATKIHIALVGDHSPEVTAHQGIEVSLKKIKTDVPELTWSWCHTDKLLNTDLKAFTGIWCVPASPYKNFEAALSAIQFARETKRPFLGTCGGFQHAVIEFARNAMGLKNADHAESNPHAELAVIQPLGCALIEHTDLVKLKPNSMAAKHCETTEVLATYRCSYGLDKNFEQDLLQSHMQISGRDEAGDARVIELIDHPFFVACLFQPERDGLRGAPHRLIKNFVLAAKNFRA